MSGAPELHDSAPHPDDDDDGAPLPWETWLRLSAKRLDRDADERAKVLEEAEIEPARWALADRYWNLTIAESLAAGDYSRSNEVAAACVRELAERKRAAASAPAAAINAPAMTSESAAASPPAAASTPITPTSSVAPSTPVVASAPTIPSSTSPGPSAPVPPEMVPLMATEGGGLKPSFLLQKEPAFRPTSPDPALPSGPSDEPSRPPPIHHGPAAPARRTPLDLGTAIGAIPGAAPLPFAPSSPGDAAALSRAKQHAAEVQSPAAHAPAPLGETEAVDIAAVARRVLAFGPSRPPASETRPAAPETRPTPLETRPASPETGPAAPERAPIAAAPPPAQPAAPPTLTVEQYASLCVDLELSPHAAAEALRRYGVTPEGKRVLDEGWSKVFAEQPARRAAFEHAKATYRAWLARGRR